MQWNNMIYNLMLYTRSALEKSIENDILPLHLLLVHSWLVKIKILAVRIETVGHP